MMDQEEMQEAVQQYQLIQQQMQSLEEYSEEISDEIEELQTTADAIDELAESDAGDEIFFPLGQGAFAKGKVVDTDEVLVDVGADTFARKDIDAASMLIDDRIEELRESQDRIRDQQEQLQDDLQELAPKLQQLQQQMQGQGGMPGQ